MLSTIYLADAKLWSATFQIVDQSVEAAQKTGVHFRVLSGTALPEHTWISYRNNKRLNIFKLNGKNLLISYISEHKQY